MNAAIADLFGFPAQSAQVEGMGAALDFIATLRGYPLAVQVEAINALRRALHEVSPFAAEPVDFVEWVLSESVTANEYNPNTVAPPEMQLLRVSIQADGYTQPIVAMPEGDGFTVVDGFHRNRVGKECPEITARVQGYLPVVRIKATQEALADRMAATVRHNRARGKHRVDAMSDIVIELKRRNWSDEKIAKNLGMEPDEILRLTQITGLAELFSDQAFSQAWDIEDLIDSELPDMEGSDE